MSRPFLYVASHCYGGLAHARFLRSVLALRAACARRDVALQLDLGGGEALLSRARAMMLARFLASDATHLLMADGDTAFEAGDVLAALDAAAGTCALEDRVVLLTRARAQALADDPAVPHARLGDIRAASGPEIAMAFESGIDAEGQIYRADDLHVRRNS